MKAELNDGHMSGEFRSGEGANMAHCVHCRFSLQRSRMCDIRAHFVPHSHCKDIGGMAFQVKDSYFIHSFTSTYTDFCTLLTFLLVLRDATSFRPNSTAERCTEVPPLIIYWFCLREAVLKVTGDRW